MVEQLVALTAMRRALAGYLGRRASAHQATALLWAMPCCTVDGCPATGHLENDHREAFCVERETELSNLDPLCRHHHRLETEHGWALVDGVGKRAMVPPDDERHPRSRRRGDVA